MGYIADEASTLRVSVRAIAQWAWAIGDQWTTDHPADDKCVPFQYSPRLPPQTRSGARERLQKDLSFDHADARGIKRLQRLRKVEAEMRSADAVVRTMRDKGQALRLSAEKQSGFLVPAVGIGCVESG